MAPTVGRAAPCATIGPRADLGGLAKVGGSRVWILVEPGAYNEALLLDGITVNLIAAGAVTLTPPAAEDAATVSNGGRVLIDGLRFSGGTARGILCNSDTGQSSLALRKVISTGFAEEGILLIDCPAVIEETQSEDNLKSGLGFYGTFSATVRDTVVRRNGVTGVAVNGTTVMFDGCRVEDNDGFGLIGSGEVVVRRSVIARNQLIGLSLGSAATVENNFIVKNGGPGAPVGGVWLSDETATFIVRFNTIADNAVDAGGSASGLQCDSTTTTLEDNIIRGQGGAVPLLGGNCNHDYSNIEGGFPAGTGNIDIAPLFADPDMDNYHLRASSPGIDQADPAATLNVDIDGDARPTDGRSDMGADEFVPN
jgi:hypothetical protein